MSSSNFNCASKNQSFIRQAKEELFPCGLGSSASDSETATAKDNNIGNFQIASSEAAEDSTQDIASPIRGEKTNPATEATTEGTQEHTNENSSYIDGELSVSVSDIKNFLGYLGRLNRGIENLDLRMEKFDRRMENFGARLEVLGDHVAELRMDHARSVELFERVADALLEQKARDEKTEAAAYEGGSDDETYITDW